MLAVISMEVLVEAVRIRDLVTPLGAAVEQIAAEDLFALASPP